MPDRNLAPSFWNNLAVKRDLWWQFTVRAVEMRHRGSYLGFAWAVLNPLLMAALYISVFGFIFKGRFNGSSPLPVGKRDQ